MFENILEPNILEYSGIFEKHRDVRRASWFFHLLMAPETCLECSRIYSNRTLEMFEKHRDVRKLFHPPCSAPATPALVPTHTFIHIDCNFAFTLI
jgi:hypothetical protein